jgi:parafibromin
MDPLSLLREYTIAGKRVVLDGKDLVFDGRRIPANTPTGWRQFRGTGDPYTIGSCWFMLQNPERTITESIQEMKEHGFQLVSLVDKKEMLSYLRGEISTSKSIVNPTTLPSPAPPASTRLSDSAQKLSSAPSGSEAPLSPPSLSSSWLDGDSETRGIKRSFSSSASSLLGAAVGSSSGLATKDSEQALDKNKKPKILAEPQDLELDDALREAKEEVAKRLDKPKVKMAPVSTTTAIPYVFFF